MAADEFSGGAGGNAHRLVVVAGRPARCKSVAEPEPVFFRDRVGKIGETGSALVSRNHQVGIVLVVPNNLRRRNDAMFPRPLGYVVIGEVNQPADPNLVPSPRPRSPPLPQARLPLATHPPFP